MSSADSRYDRHDVFAAGCLLAIMFAWAGDPPPMVNEAHYLVKAKNFWDPDWCRNDLFAASGKAHATYYFVFGWLTRFCSLPATAWALRWAGWVMLAVALQRLTRQFTDRPYRSLPVLIIWVVATERLNLAGEWVVGGTEAKVPAYALVLWGLADLTRGRWAAVWPAMGGAAAFHVLVGGWSVVAAAVAFVIGRWQTPDDHRIDRRWLIGLCVGGGLSLIGLIPAVALARDVSSADAAAAARIYVYQRLSHHLLPTAFPGSWWWRFGGLTMLTSIAWAGSRSRRVDSLAAYVAGTLAIAAGGVAIAVLPGVPTDTASSLLRFYWFRLSDVMVPLLLAMSTLSSTWGWRSIRFVHGPAAVSLIACVVWASTALDRARISLPPSVMHPTFRPQSGDEAAQQQRIHADWIAVCDYVRHCTRRDEVFLTPRHQQSFKWYAHRAEVVNFKDVPQDATSLLEWSRRFAEVFPARLRTMRVTIRYRELVEFRRRWGVRYLIVDRRITGDHLPLVRRYPVAPETNATYAIYELPPVPADGKN